MEKLSPRQEEVLRFLVRWLQEHGVPPSYREIGSSLGIRSTNGVSDHVRALERKGYIDRVGGHGSARSLRVTDAALEALGLSAGDDAADLSDDDAVVGVPVLGRIAAGLPILAEEDHDTTLRVDRGLLPAGRGEVFALVVRGDSMIDDGIFHGDYVFVRRQDTCRDGEIAAVLVDGEATVKRLFREAGRIRLQPANAEMAPILVGRDVSECRVMGVVVGVYRRVH